MKGCRGEDGPVPPAKAVALADLVTYAKDSIVSRTIAENGAGTITAFSFDAGQGLSEHSAPFDAVVQILDGEGVLVIGGRAVRAAAGRMVIMPANVPHAVRAEKRFKMLLTMLRAKPAPRRRAGRRGSRG